MGQLDGKIALITGAGAGIGKGIARAFAREGAALIVASRSRQHLEATAGELRALGATALVAPTDVTDEQQVIALFAQAIDAFGRLDILVNNAGVFDGGPLEELSLETWRKVIDVNLTGPDNPIDEEPMMTPDELALAAVTMAALPLHVNMLEAIVLPTTQLYLGRG
jgi:NADP-dependent 3-hydroxy acid dehydrogenase YdfG